ncbi:GntR family transcriptional regulator [Pleionea sp. CnH1-48]|uniref:GntR family transcriptional regulator n=1 Tax=Pleionea sp. CnH1-48 TaxID=2954494 RepID=UPI0020975B77|nr:GntR family transcriptional regulator [Pleionea sp. CnH1-48]MCO7227245.1 GntR family transcriptional regulator [Pleionea sp. CnH1-48]
MQASWNDNQPIYRQLRDKVIASILDGELGDGDALPSVRQVSADFQLNPITVSKAYQELVDGEIVEKKRGLGMFVKTGARDTLLTKEREKFLTEDWPVILERIERLGLSASDLLAAGKRQTEGSDD